LHQKVRTTAFEEPP